MDINSLDKAIQKLDLKRDKLASLDYNDPKYDDLEEELHDLEDDFQDKYGDYLEDILQDIHDKYCPDNDVLLPIAYMGDGAIVESDEFPGKDTRLFLLPNPARVVLQVGKDKQLVVWPS